MCGIVGFIGKHDVKKDIIQSLRGIEYRGYDACGAAFLKNNNFEIFKSIKGIDDLNKQINTSSNISIAHTRWSTHGMNTILNAHPHISNNKLFALVHNGTIYNYKELKNYLLEIGYTFYSSTDSEVIVNYLSYLYDKYLDIFASLKELNKILKGTYSIVILHAYENKLYFLKKDTSLYIALKEDKLCLTSDINILKPNDKYFPLDDNFYGYISLNKIAIYKNKKTIKPKFKSFEHENDVNKTKYKYYLEKEINEIPNCIKRQNQYFQSNEFQKIKEIIKDKKLIFIGSGTSYHAALYSMHFFKQKVESYIASEYYQEKLQVESNAIYIFLSQSGETMDVLKALSYVKKENVISICLTNNINSELANKVNYIINLNANKEISVASTKAYILQIYTLYALSKNIIQEIKLKNLSLKEKEEIYNLAKEIKDSNNAYFISKNYNYYLAMEASLKLKEVSYIHVEPLYNGELKHGSISLLENNFPCLIITNAKNKYFLSTEEEIKSHHGKVYYFIYKHNSLTSMFKMMMKIYYLSFYCALLKNNNIDKPRNLAKSVTVE